MNEKQTFDLLWEKWLKEKNPTQEELWEMYTSYEPSYICAECGYPDFTIQCKNCGSKKSKLMQTRLGFEIDYINNELLEKKLNKE